MKMKKSPPEAKQLLRQFGQDKWEPGHRCMHSTWKPHLHLSRTLIPTPPSNFARHMAHSAPGSPSPAEYATVGVWAGPPLASVRVRRCSRGLGGTAGASTISTMMALASNSMVTEEWVIGGHHVQERET